MKQIYDFSKTCPPVLTEKMLQEKMQKKQQERTIFLVLLSSLLTIFCLYLISARFFSRMPLLSAAVFIYVCTAVSVLCVLLLFISQKRSFEL